MEVGRSKTVLVVAKQAGGHWPSTRPGGPHWPGEKERKSANGGTTKEGSMVKVLTCAFVLASFAFIGFSPKEAKAKTEYTITCPTAVWVGLTLKWTWRINGPVPGTYMVPSSQYYVHPELWAPFRESELLGQRIHCRFTGPTPANVLVVWSYGYTFTSKVISCSGIPGRVVQCIVEK